MGNYLLYTKLAVYLLKKMRGGRRKHYTWVKCPYCRIEQLIQFEPNAGTDYFRCKCNETFRATLECEVDQL